MTVMPHYILWTLCALIFIYAALVVMTFLFQRNMMYFPSKNLSISTSAIEGMNEVKIITKDNITLNSWFIAPSNPTMPVIISFHGNASNMEWQSKRLLPFAKSGYGVLIASYRGYNGNEGKPTEQGLYEDARAQINFLIGQGFKTKDIVLYGESLGTGVAVEMAADKIFERFKAVILESPYTSTIDVAKRVYPYLPISKLMRDRYESLSKIKNVQSPIIIAHGHKDKVVPYNQGKHLFDTANDPKIFIDMPEGAHANLGDFDVTQKYIEILSNFEKRI